MSDILHEDTFHGTKKGGQRKYVRKAYEKSKQLRSKSPMKRINVKVLIGNLQMVKRDNNIDDFTLDKTISDLIRISR